MANTSSSIIYYKSSSFLEGEFTNKLGFDLQLLLSNPKSSESNPIRIITIFQNRAVMEEGISKVLALSTKIQLLQKWQFISAAVFITPAEFIKDIAQYTEVRKIWLDHVFSIVRFFGIPPDNTLVTEINEPSENNPVLSKNSENFEQIYNGTNVIVALLDTGVDISHPDLRNSILAFGGVSMVEGDPLPIDFHGHGTFCAGVITGDGIKNASFKGVAPGADILNIKVLSSLGIGLWSWIISGIEYAITHGADIIAMCFSMPGYPDDPVNLAINQAIERGMIVVTAVGDDGPAYSSVSSPGMAAGAITVGAYNDATLQVASFSGRGPTLSFHSKPDLLASGVDITSCRPVNNLTNLLPGNFPINITDFFQGGIGYGQNVSEYYTVVNSTNAAAANITGVIASLLQHAKFLTAEELKIILQETATPLPSVGPNVQGAGLVNLTKAHLYLIQHNLNKSLLESRLYTPSLFSPWSVTSQNSTRNSTLLVTNYGTLLGMLESYQNSTFTHMIQGQFAVKYNNQIKWLSDMYVLRELHNITANFSIIQSIITDYTLLYIFTAEGLSSASGFRVNLTLVNLESTPISNLSVFSIWNTDLFWNLSDQTSHDIGGYNVNDDIIYVNDSNNGNSSYIGFSGMIPSISHEVNSSANITSQIYDGTLQNNSIFSGNNPAIAMEWFLTSNLNGSEYYQYSQYIGIGDSYNTLNDSIQTIQTYKVVKNMTNLALLSSNFSRIGFIGQPYNSKVLLMNLGNVAVNNTFMAFLVNSTDAQTQTFFSKYISLGRLNPFEFRWVNVSWNPTDVDIYSAYWIVGTEAIINSVILYFLNISQQILQEQNFLDNFYIRNIFIKDNSFKLHNLFPKNLPIAPQLIYFPNDVAIFNVSITTNHPLTNLQIQPLEGNLSTDWISYNIPSNLQNHGSLQITLAIPHNPKGGLYIQKLNITADNTHIGEIWVNFSVQYPSGRVLFYKPALNFSFQSSLQITDLLTIWNERLDTIYGGYFEFFNICIQNNYDVDDFGLLKQFSANISLDSIISLPFELPFPTDTLQENSTYVSNYDLVILCDPEIELSQGEIDALIDFGQNGGSLFFWVEPDAECEHSSINSILNPFDIQINDSKYLITNQTFIDPNAHEISLGLTEIKLYDFVTFQNLSTLTVSTQYNNSDPTIILNDTSGKILCVGDSSLFNDSCITEADNYHFLNNSINWLLKEKINISLTVNKDEAEPLRMNQHLSLSIHLTSINGTDLSENMTLFTFLIMPSNRCLYMIFFHVQEGWYNTIYLDTWLNETGSYYLVIYANSPNHTSNYLIQHLILEDALPSDDGDPSLGREGATNFEIFLGILIALLISNVIMGIFFYQRRQWHRKMALVELKEKMSREISNLLSEYNLYVKEVEELLSKPKILDPDKLRMIVDKQERKKELLNKLKKLGKKV